MSHATFTLNGLKEFQAIITKLAHEFPKKVDGAAFRACEEIMGRSKDEFVPTRDAILKGTGRVEIVRRAEDGGIAEIGMLYGGPSAPYALAVHEHLSDHSPPSWIIAETSGNPVRFSPAGHGPKYLEIPMNEKAATLEQDLRDDLALDGIV